MEGRLWSLWDIMERYRAENLVDLSVSLGRFGMWGHALERVGNPDDLRRLLAAMRSEMVRAGLQHSLYRLDRIERQADASGERPGSEQAREYRELAVSIEDELKSIYFLRLSGDEASCLQRADAFWGQAVSAKFQSLQYDVSEAAKCYALGRSTSSVFHAVRCLEGGVRAIARCLGIQDPTSGGDRSWAKILQSVKDATDRRWPNTANRSGGDGRFFEEVYALFAAMKNPYRNSTMHLDQKYTEEEARHLLEVIGGVMRKIAARCDENGDPRA